MSRLQKGLEDYFTIPILLKPLHETKESSVKNLHKLLSSYPQTFLIQDDYPYPQSGHSRILQERPSVSQCIRFMMKDFENLYTEFEVIYRCRFVIGVFEARGQKVDLTKVWNQAVKQCAEDNRKMVGMLILELG